MYIFIPPSKSRLIINHSYKHTETQTQIDDEVIQNIESEEADADGGGGGGDEHHPEDDGDPSANVL